MVTELFIGDIVTTKKPHPCGCLTWTVIRVGADIKIKCTKCSRIVMMDRAELVKKIKKIERSVTDDSQSKGRDS
ncbi:MAG TPA: DUF951 domain-containing protein [Clostridia bacterium]|nr:DUF951 domain-containing protein [Clostridia bacterium]